MKIISTVIFLFLCAGLCAGMCTHAAAQGFTEQQILNFEYAYETRLAYDVDGNVEYIGKAAPGTLTSASGWQIKKITYSSGDAITIKYASGSSGFTGIWDSRADYTY